MSPARSHTLTHWAATVAQRVSARGRLLRGLLLPRRPWHRLRLRVWHSAVEARIPGGAHHPGVSLPCGIHSIGWHALLHGDEEPPRHAGEPQHRIYPPAVQGAHDDTRSYTHTHTHGTSGTHLKDERRISQGFYENQAPQGANKSPAALKLKWNTVCPAAQLPTVANRALMKAS
jgi:hypothetical protein